MAVLCILVVVCCFSCPLRSSVELLEQPPAASSFIIGSGADLLLGTKSAFLKTPSFFPSTACSGAALLLSPGSFWSWLPCFRFWVLVVALPSSRFIPGSALAVFSVVKCKQRWANTARELQNSGKSGYSSKALRPTWDLELWITISAHPAGQDRYSGLLGPKKKNLKGPGGGRGGHGYKVLMLSELGELESAPQGLQPPLWPGRRQIWKWGRAEAPAPPFHPSLRGLTLGSVQPLGF